ncbi:glycosyltransferase family 2 protein [Rhodococcus oxybenzonivorans]|uniref:glycosyltransferase n=1 Tax=Rhodococcus oxybenzonivorans TaxID=1990687 RepID=UPI002955A765|nr:glycosyltransferase family 2 protein [Rhodococcus oxybenzonivorans]MDV7355737.1 glycosyltransferase family 2 protein [Rhodococcus oxybenzonivorans]
MSISTLSVVIPAYNEEAAIQECLDRIFEQIDHIDEVIVVDNNSTDATAAIVAAAQHREPKVRLVKEVAQGCAPARSAGMNSATGDIVARIDVDTKINENWAANIKSFFSRHSDRYAAATGTCTCYDLPFQGLFASLQRKMNAKNEAKLERGESIAAPGLFGSNMAILKTAWEDIKSALHDGEDVHEDTDLSLTLQSEGLSCAMVPGMEASISGRRYLSPVGSYWRYVLRGPRTLALHGKRLSAALGTFAVAATAMPFYLLMWVPFRAWDPERESFSLGRLFAGAERRPQPRAHV